MATPSLAVSSRLSVTRRWADQALATPNSARPLRSTNWHRGFGPGYGAGSAHQRLWRVARVWVPTPRTLLRDSELYRAGELAYRRWPRQ